MNKTKSIPVKISKSEVLIKALNRKSGATIQKLTTVTGWQTHSVRAALSGLRKRGLEITRAKTDKGNVYHIAKPAETA